MLTIFTGYHHDISTDIKIIIGLVYILYW